MAWLYGSWIYNYLCNQHLSPLMLVQIRVRCTTLCDKVCQWLAAGRLFFPVSSTNKTDSHNITEILLKVALNTIKQTKQTTEYKCYEDKTYDLDSILQLLRLSMCRCNLSDLQHLPHKFRHSYTCVHNRHLFLINENGYHIYWYMLMVLQSMS